MIQAGDLGEGTNQGSEHEGECAWFERPGAGKICTCGALGDLVLDQDLKDRIHKMTHYDLAKHWRFSQIGTELMVGIAGKYLHHRLYVVHGGITPEMSKSLGWGR